MTDEYALGVLKDLKDACHEGLRGVPFVVIRITDMAFDYGILAIMGEKVPKTMKPVTIQMLTKIKAMFKNSLSSTKDAEDIDTALQKALVRLAGSDWDD
jgi:hypothetical protein